MAVNKSRITLGEEERKVLRTLSRKGAMSPGQVSAETLILPGDTMTTLRGLADAGLVVMRDDYTPEGKVAIVTEEGRDVANNYLDLSISEG